MHLQGTTVMHTAPRPGETDATSAAAQDIDHPHDHARLRRELCRSLIRERTVIDRRTIKRFHANADFAMLLSVYLAEAEGRETYQCEVAQAATIASSTAHRKLGDMVRRGILARKRTIIDRRRVCLILAAETRTMLETLLDHIARDRQSHHSVDGKPSEPT